MVRVNRRPTETAVFPPSCLPRPSQLPRPAHGFQLQAEGHSSQCPDEARHGDRLGMLVGEAVAWHGVRYAEEFAQVCAGTPHHDIVSRPGCGGEARMIFPAAWLFDAAARGHAQVRMAQGSAAQERGSRCVACRACVATRRAQR